MRTNVVRFPKATLPRFSRDEREALAALGRKMLRHGWIRNVFSGSPGGDEIFNIYFDDAPPGYATAVAG
jgi:hypothetical protein